MERGRWPRRQPSSGAVSARSCHLQAVPLAHRQGDDLFPQSFLEDLEDVDLEPPSQAPGKIFQVAMPMVLLGELPSLRTNNGVDHGFEWHQNQ